MTASQLATGLVSRLEAAHLTVGTAESLTGGLVCAALTSVPGASAVVRGGVVAYARDVKAEVLGVDRGLLDREGAVHEEVARQLAERTRRVLGCDVGIATTGVAGPDAADGMPVGTVFVAAAGPWGILAERHAFPGDRSAIRAASVRAALQLAEQGLDNLQDDVGAARYGGEDEVRPVHHEEREEAP